MSRFKHLKALTHNKDFHKDFCKKSLGKSLFIYKTVEKIVAVVKKSCVVWTITTFFAVSVVVCKGLKHEMRL